MDKSEFIAQEINPNLRASGIKFIVCRADDEITTWHTVFDRPSEDILDEVKHDKGWIGGTILEVYIEFVTDDGKYFKEYLDLTQQTKLQNRL